MSYVLIIAFMTGSAGLYLPAFSMQEFDSKSSCDTALAAVRDMADSMKNTNREVVKARCVPK